MRSIISILLSVAFFVSANAQYTETINSNFPGGSMGAYAVGKGVFQVESGFRYERLKHKYLPERSSTLSANYTLRYGAFFEPLELLAEGNVDYEMLYRPTTNSSENNFSFFPQTLGVKWLLFNYLYDDSPDLHSWKNNQKIQWKRWIPSVGLFVGAAFGKKGDFDREYQSLVTPRVILSFQSQLLDDTVFVLNLKGDYLTQDFRAFTYVVTLTHNINASRFSVFIENEGSYSKYDNEVLFRTGGAYLFSRNFQINLDAEAGLKQTPSRYAVLLGVSYRWDKKRWRQLKEEALQRENQ